MRAVICRSGGANAYADAPFEYAAEWPRPQLGDLHDTFHHLPCPAAATCLVRVGFSSMNPADRGTDDHRTPKVMGSDIAGTIIAVGPGCSRLKVGDEVWGDIGANASFSTAAAGGAVTTKQLGAWAEVCVALETQLSLKPSNITQLEAGVLPKVALTSWKALAWYADARAWSSRTVGAPTVLILLQRLRDLRNPDRASLWSEGRAHHLLGTQRRVLPRPRSGHGRRLYKRSLGRRLRPRFVGCRV